MALVRTELVPLVAAPGRRLPADASAGAAAWAARVVADGVDRSVVRRRVDVLLERHGASLYDYVARLSGDGAAAAAAGIVADVLADAALTPLPPLSAADAREAPDPDRLATLDLFARATTRCLGAPSWSARRPSPWNALAGVAARLRRRRPRRDPAPVATAAGGAGEDGGALDVLRSLPPTQRACVLLREHHRFAYREIAAVLGTSPAAVAPLLASAREALARRCPVPGYSGLPMGPTALKT
jgi:hypothetical protein